MSIDTSAPVSDLLLKVTPPRVPRHLVARPGLAAGHPEYRERPVVLVQAPAGFGKTSLLAQWRREHLARGAVVAWLSAQPQDDPVRFVQGLALSVRSGAGRPTFGHVLLDAPPARPLEGITVWLAEVARSALDIVLIVDEADRLPDASREALSYLLHNAPPSLRCIVASRVDCRLGVDDLVAYGHCAVVGAAQLRFGLEEVIGLMRLRFGNDVDRDEAARLHEMTEGWPLGLQLALSVAGSGVGRAVVPAFNLDGGPLRAQFVGMLLGNLDPVDLDFLTRISLADPLYPGLCRALLESETAPAQLERLVRDTPVFIAGEQGDWVRMHSLACEALRQRFEALPAGEQAGLHARACDWLAQHGMLDAAAGHALKCGQEQRAYDLAERSLYESLMSQGRQGSVLAWLERLPAGELDRRPRLLLAGAWSLALSERHDEAQQLVARILAQPDVDDELRCECALILGGAAIFADDPDRFAALHDPWSEAPPLREPKLLRIHANRTAFRSLLDGEPALARLRQQHAPAGAAPGYLDRWSDFIIALSYLWEGQVLLVDKLVRPALAKAEADLGRRSAFACMLAALLASALWEQDQPDEASALLANRLDVLESSGLPETVLLAYRTAARIATAAGSEPRALELLGAMDAIGSVRQLPRLRIASLAEQVRLHAGRFRAETCRDLCRQIASQLKEQAPLHGPLWQRSVGTLQALAEGYAAIAAQEWRLALQALERAGTLAQGIKQGRVHIEVMGLRALALDRCGEKALPLLREAQDLARSFGLQRVFVDAHPALGEWVRESGLAGAAAGSPPVPSREPAPPADAARLRAMPSLALTPKEREVLELAARNLSNKEIGLAMQVGEETVKWHMKNLFAKLDAGTRKQVVSRARILGLLADSA